MSGNPRIWRDVLSNRQLLAARCGTFFQRRENCHPHCSDVVHATDMHQVRLWNKRFVNNWWSLRRRTTQTWCQMKSRTMPTGDNHPGAQTVDGRHDAGRETEQDWYQQQIEKLRTLCQARPISTPNGDAPKKHPANDQQPQSTQSEQHYHTAGMSSTLPLPKHTGM